MFDKLAPRSFTLNQISPILITPSTNISVSTPKLPHPSNTDLQTRPFHELTSATSHGEPKELEDAGDAYPKAQEGGRGCLANTTERESTRHQTTQKRKHDAQTDQQDTRPTKKAVAEHASDAAERLHAKYREPAGPRKSGRIAGLPATSPEDAHRDSEPTTSNTDAGIDTPQNTAVDAAQAVEVNVAGDADTDDTQDAAVDQASATSLPRLDAAHKRPKTPDGDSPVLETGPSEPTARVIAARKARIHESQIPECPI